MEVYTLSGIQLREGVAYGEALEGLDRGIYIVRAGNVSLRLAKYEIVSIKKSKPGMPVLLGIPGFDFLFCEDCFNAFGVDTESGCAGGIGTGVVEEETVAVEYRAIVV